MCAMWYVRCDCGCDCDRFSILSLIHPHPSLQNNSSPFHEDITVSMIQGVKRIMAELRRPDSKVLDGVDRAEIFAYLRHAAVRLLARVDNLLSPAVSLCVCVCVCVCVCLVCVVDISFCSLSSAFPFSPLSSLSSLVPTISNTHPPLPITAADPPAVLAAPLVRRL